MNESNPIDDAWVLVTTPTQIDGNHVATHYALPTKHNMFQVWQWGVYARWFWRLIIQKNGKVITLGDPDGYDTLDKAKYAIAVWKQEGRTLSNGDVITRGLTPPTR